MKLLSEDRFNSIKEASDISGISSSSINSLLLKELIEIKEEREFRQSEF